MRVVNSSPLMQHMRRGAIGLLTIGLLTAAAPSALALDLPQKGEGHYRVWGLRIYDARLNASAGTTSDNWTQQPLRLTLRYHRGFSAQAIAQRSIDEMQRQGPISATQERQWRQHLLACLRDVQDQDQLSASFDGQARIRLAHQGQETCKVDDAEFAQRFLAIWLGPQTSAPELRQALFGQSAS